MRGREVRTGHAGRMDATLLAGERLAGLARAPLTYPEVGATLSTEGLPAGYHHLRRQAVIGQGADDLERSAGALLGWAMHRGAGVRVLPSSPQVRAAAVADLRVGLGPLSLRAPVRVVGVLDEPRRRGFAYGTLPGHPESGEESFIVSIGDDDIVTFTVQAFSRPGGMLTRVAGPVARMVQRGITDRYVRSLQSLV